MKREEDILQAECFQWFWNEYPHLRRTLFHVPNGGVRSKIEAARLKAMGVVAGVADLIFLYNQKAYVFELKSPTGTLEPDQVIFQHVMISQNIPHYLIRDFITFQSTIKSIINEN